MCVAFGALGGCSPTPADGYSFSKAQYVETKFATQIILVSSQEQLLKLAPAGTEKPGRTLMAFAKLNRGAGRCTIYMVDARKAYQPEWLGHELAHCVYGNWHGDQA
jgi:hypothetical protein